MKVEMYVKNELMTNRLITDYGMTGFQLRGVDLKIEGQVDEPEGFMVGMTEVRALFDEMIGDSWNCATLVENGVSVGALDSSTVYVDFSPSLENISRYIYDTMAYEIMRRFNVLLVGVMSKSDLGDIYYSPELTKGAGIG